jgi:hypothetical protein
MRANSSYKIRNVVPDYYPGGQKRGIVMHPMDLPLFSKIKDLDNGSANASYKFRDVINPATQYDRVFADPMSIRAAEARLLGPIIRTDIAENIKQLEAALVKNPEVVQLPEFAKKIIDTIAAAFDAKMTASLSKLLSHLPPVYDKPEEVPPGEVEEEQLERTLDISDFNLMTEKDKNKEKAEITHLADTNQFKDQDGNVVPVNDVLEQKDAFIDKKKMLVYVPTAASIVEKFRNKHISLQEFEAAGTTERKFMIKIMKTNADKNPIQNSGQNKKKYMWVEALGKAVDLTELRNEGKGKRFVLDATTIYPSGEVDIAWAR